MAPLGALDLTLLLTNGLHEGRHGVTQAGAGGGLFGDEKGGRIHIFIYERERRRLGRLSLSLPVVSFACDVCYHLELEVPGDRHRHPP